MRSVLNVYVVSISDENPYVSVGELPICLEIAFCSSVLNHEGKDQVGDEIEQSVCHQVVPQSNEIDHKADHRVYRQSRLTAPSDPPQHKYSNTINTFKTPILGLERVNPSPFPTYSSQESEWAKAEVAITSATQCSRVTELIKGKLLEREFTPTIGWPSHKCSTIYHQKH
ncbi:hypothetical protein H5410_002179, partial [Solanum commersonii]